jgi:hypothetical protein
MTPLTTAAAATRTVRVIRSPPGSQLERNRAFWRMISASFMQVSDAHLHRRNRRRSAPVCDAIFCDPSTSYHGTKDHPVWASVPIATDPNKYDLSVLLALNQCHYPIKVYESIISSGIAGTEYGRLPWLALSVMSGHTSNAASEGCHSIAQLIMSDLHFHG